MHNHDRRKALALVGRRMGAEPVVENGFAAAERGQTMRLGQRLGSGECHGAALLRIRGRLPGSMALKYLNHFWHRLGLTIQQLQECGNAIRLDANDRVLHDHFLGGPHGSIAHELCPRLAS